MMTRRLTLAAALGAALLLANAARALAQAEAADAERASESVSKTGGAAEVTMLKLRDGAILWGTIEDHDIERLGLRRLDNGGLVRLGWDRLDPVQSERLRERFGYADGSSEEVMTEADRLILRDGTELVGKIVNRTQDELWIKTATRTLPVPKLRLAGAATVVQVPALDVYSSEELYREALLDLEPEDPASQLELALFSERVLAFEQALEHVERALALDPEFQPEQLAGHRERIARKHENAEQIGVLREIDLWRTRGRFDRALELARGFEERFPESPLREDARRKLGLVERGMEQALGERVASLWHHAARKLVREKAMDPDASFEAAVAWIDESLSEEVLTRVHEEVQRSVSSELTPEDVRRHFDQRERVRWQKATYGEGTWLLGEADALAGLEVSAPKEAQTERDSERERIKEKIRRYMKNQEVIRRAKSAEVGGDDDQQDFWKTWSSNGRAGWLLAYYAENGGDMQLREPIFRNCSQCGGTGTREIINTGNARSTPSRGRGSNQTSSGIGVIECPTCKHIGKWRTVSFR